MTTEPERREKSAACERTWEIEAARDGRLSDAAKAGLERHVEECAVCRKEEDTIEGLGRALRELEAPAIDDVALRRLRQRVLQRSDAELAGRSVPPGPVGSRRLRYMIPALAFAAVMLAWLGSTRWKSTPVVRSPDGVAETKVDVIDEGGARWTRHTEGEVENVELNDGTLRVRVHNVPGGKRLMVRVPDGEIEDLGTVFYVVVRDGVTQRVGVDEGRVTVRLKDAAPITISSGHTWERSEPPTTTLPLRLPIPALPAVSVHPSSSAHGVPRSEPTERVAPAPQRADQEDAAYLRTLKLLREGHEAEARHAARDYLRSFPDGFRREEMGRIANARE